MKQTVHVIGKPRVELNTDDLAFPISQPSSMMMIHHTSGTGGTFGSRRKITADNMAASRSSAE